MTDTETIARIENRLNEPPLEVACPLGCLDGLMWGTDANGGEVSERCPHRCHMTEDELQAEAGDRRYQEDRDEGRI